MKKAVQAVILNDENEVLAVSRKNDHNDMGLPGGKVDDKDYLGYPYNELQTALIREVKEETGLDIDVNTSELIFAIHKDGYMSYTYLIKKWSGDIETDEPHVVRWTHFEEIMMGSFGKYNSLVCESLLDLGLNFKMYPDSMGIYMVATYEDDINVFDGEPYFTISPNVEDVEDATWDISDWPEGMWREIVIMFDEHNLILEQRDQQRFTVTVDGRRLSSKEELDDIFDDSDFFINRIDY